MPLALNFKFIFQTSRETKKRKVKFKSVLGIKKSEKQKALNEFEFRFPPGEEHEKKNKTKKEVGHRFHGN